MTTETTATPESTAQTALEVTQEANVAPLSSSQLEKVDALAKSIDLMDPTITITYGTKTMQSIANFADGLLSTIKAKDAGPVGEALTTLMLQVRKVDVDAIAGNKKGFLESIPLIGTLFNSAERSIAEFKTLASQVEGITTKLDDSMHKLLIDIETLEQLYQHNKNFHDELSIAILAGKQRLETAKTVELPALQQEAQDSPDTMSAQKVRDFADKMNRFERRLHDLQLSRTITLQTAPQIRLIQSNNQTLAEKIQTSILATIPIWKSQMVLGVSLHGQKSAAQLQKHVADTTNELLQKNADLLKDSAVSTAREVERSFVDIETLRDVHKKLIGTIEETIAIAQEGRERRQSVEKELANMEQDLRQQLTSLASTKRNAEIAHAQNAELPAAEKD